jgi:hypothetical protein
VPRIVLDGSAEGLALDDALYELLPPIARRGWDEIRPQGTLDVEVHYDSAALDAARARWAALATQPPALTAPAPHAAAAAAGPGETKAPPSGVRVVLKPRALAATLKAMPYRLEALTGTIVVDEDRVYVEDVAGRHGDGTVAVDGTGLLGARPVWELRVRGDDLPVDDALREAMPETLAGLAEAIKLGGTVGFDLTRFAYRGPEAPPVADADVDAAPPAPGAAPSPPNPAAAAAEAAAVPGAHPEIDLAGTVHLAGAKLDVGVPLTDVAGGLKLAATVRGGHLQRLRGNIDLGSMKMAGREARDFRAELFKPPGQSELRLENMRGKVAGGAMSGGMTLVYPEDGPSRYALELVVRDADVRALAWEDDDAAVKGRLNASLSLEGSWGDAGARRGRGDVR